MIRQEQFINKVRELGYKFKRQTQRVSIYKKKGTTHRITVPRTSTLTKEYAKSTLRQCKCSEDEIETFLGNCNS